MRRGLVLIWLGATAVVSTLAGVFSYQAGWAAGLATKLPDGAAPYYYGPHPFGFGPGPFPFAFGLLPFLFVLFVVWFVFRAGRGWGRGGWGPGGGWGPRGGGPGQPAGQPAGQTPPPNTGDPWQGWPERPPSEQPPSGPRQA
jgi:hypothetical protein